MARLQILIDDSELYGFAQRAHKARFPAFAWKTVARDMMGLPVGAHPTPSQIINQPHAWLTLWLELTLRFEQMTTVRWAEHIELEQERIHNALMYLGATSDVIAERLALMGVAGTSEESCDCPLAHFFRGVYDAWFVRAFTSDVYIDFVEVNNPHAAESFVREFDNGCRTKLDLFPDYPVYR